MESQATYDLEKRLIDFATAIIEWAAELPNFYANQILRKQLIRSSTSSALNYGEAQAAESSRDFVHKMKLVLKELRETHICLQILNRINAALPNSLLQESSQLVAIFAASIKTASKKL